MEDPSSLEQARKEEKRKMIVTLCNRILKAPASVILRARTTPINQLRAVIRASKDTRDPNPLASTMIAMGAKYPISIDSKKAKQFGVPKELIGPTDTHRLGRKICKKEAVDWYISQNFPISNDERAVVDSLSAHLSKEVKDYYNLNWAAARIRWGPPTLNREPVQGGAEKSQIPKDQIIPAIIQVLLPEYNIPYGAVGQTALEVAKRVAIETLPSKINFLQQARLLINVLSNNWKFLPVPPGMAHLAYMEHSLGGPHHKVLVEIGAIERQRDSGIDEALSSLGRATIILCQRGVMIREIKKSLHITKIMTEPLSTSLVQCDHENIYTKVLKAALGFKCTLSSTMFGVTFYPMDEHCASTKHVRPYGAPVILYLNESVAFESGDMVGVFHHNGAILTNVTCKWTTRNEFTSTISAIAAYIKLNYTAHPKKRSLKALTRTIRDEFYNKPWEVINISARKYLKIDGTEGTYGKLMITNNVDLPPRSSITCELTSNGLVYNGHKLDEFTITPKSPTIPDYVAVPLGPYDDFTKPPERLFRKILFYAQNYSQVLQHIQMRDFTWRNDSIPRQSIARIQSGIGKKVWKVLCSTYVAKLPPPQVCLLYCFGACPCDPKVPEISEFKWENCLIDFDGEKGLVKREGTVWTVNLKKIDIKEHRADNELLTAGGLSDFDMAPTIGPEPPRRVYVSLGFLAENAPTIQEGKSFYTIVDGVKYKCTKRCLMRYNIHDTLARQFQAQQSAAYEESWKKRAVFESLETGNVEPITGEPAPKRFKGSRAVSPLDDFEPAPEEMVALEDLEDMDEDEDVL